MMRRMPPSPPSRLSVYQTWLGTERGLHFADYAALWHWSVTDLDAFWASVWDFFDEQLTEVLDSLVVDLEVWGRESWMPLFVVLRDGVTLDDTLVRRLKASIRDALSPRHLPSEIFQVPAVPRTLSGKKMELPVKKLLLGADPARVMQRDAMANADCVDWYVALASARSAPAGAGFSLPPG
jgi:hypothetical protein